MGKPDIPTASRPAAKAVGRCYGAIFFLAFGGVWFLLSDYAWGHLKRSGALAIAGMVCSLIAVVLRVQARGKVAAQGAYSEEEERRNYRHFGIVNSVTWISVFLAFQIMPRLGHKELSIPVAEMIVGLHFFFMPPLYRHTANQVLGGFLVAWGIACPLLWQGNPMVGYLAFGAGAALWLSAAWAVKTARDLLNSVSL